MDRSIKIYAHNVANNPGTFSEKDIEEFILEKMAQEAKEYATFVVGCINEGIQPLDYDGYKKLPIDG